jgi:hypothetical protein
VLLIILLEFQTKFHFFKSCTKSSLSYSKGRSCARKENEIVQALSKVNFTV